MNRGPGCRRRAGYVLIVCLLLLVGISVAGAALLRTTVLQERIAAQARDKQRAFEAAQAALRYGERWLDAGGGLIAACTAGAHPVGALQVCTGTLGTGTCLASLAGAQQDPMNWPARFEFTPAAMAVSTRGGITASGDVQYAAPPGLYIEAAGSAPTGAGDLYCVAAYGYGGAPGTVSVVRSVYLVPGGSGGSGGTSTGGSP